MKGLWTALRVAALGAALTAAIAAGAGAQDAEPPADGAPEMREPGPRPESGPSAAPRGVTPPPESARRYLDAAEFRTRYENKTVHLMAGGRHYGSEYYLPGDKSIWIGDGGPCQKGVWAYVTPQFCFQYGDNGPHCWTVFDANGVTYAQSIDGLVLEIYAVDKKPLSCAPELFS